MTLYFYTAGDRQWTTLANWWQDLAHGVQAAALPIGTDDCVVVAGSLPPILTLSDPAFVAPATIDASALGTEFVLITASNGGEAISAGCAVTGNVRVEGDVRSTFETTGNVVVENLSGYTAWDAHIWSGTLTANTGAVVQVSTELHGGNATFNNGSLLIGITMHAGTSLVLNNGMAFGTDAMINLSDGGDIIDNRGLPAANQVVEDVPIGRSGVIGSLHLVQAGTVGEALLAALAIKAKTDLIGSNAADSPNAVAAQAKAAMIGAATVTYSGPMAADGSWQVYAGARAILSWTITPWTAAKPASAVLTIGDEESYKAGPTAAAIITKSCAMDLANSVLTVSCALSATDTASLPTTPRYGASALRAQVYETTGASDPTALVDARGKCVRKIAAGV